MDERIHRFKHLDSRFYPRLNDVLARLPADVREAALNDANFQILSKEEFQHACTLPLVFDPPASFVIYVNPRLLQEAEYRQNYTLAREMARFVTVKQDRSFDDKTADDLLISWGFEKEAAAVHFDLAVADTSGFKSGYDWAKKQNTSYLLQHFGLYFDQWNDSGFAQRALPRPDLKTEPESIVEDLKARAPAAAATNATVKGISNRDAVMAGILAAVKEIKFQETYGIASCRPSTG
jgi:hypothetical protein